MTTSAPTRPPGDLEEDAAAEETTAPPAEAAVGDVEEPRPEPEAEPGAESEPGGEQPADVDDGAPSAVIELKTAFGSLTLDPRQTELTTAQKLALVAIGIDTAADPRVIPHVRPFIHMCQIRGLDPWAREAYLIGRGKGDNRKFTMQVGIDGYLKMAAATRRFIRVKETLWTGKDDDTASWREDARGVMRRRWWDQWPTSKGEPGAAMAVIEHYDEAGMVTETEAVADWGMYAPYNPKWEDKPGGGSRKVLVDGKPVMELTDMWARGGPHMLAKCAIALACRRAFPGATAGIYMHEEMHQADAIERRREEAEKVTARRRFVEERREAQAAANAPAPEGRAQVPSIEQVLSGPSQPDVPHVIDGEVGEVVDAEVVDAGVLGTTFEGSDVDRRQWLLDELDVMADITGSSVAALTRRWGVKAKKNAADATLPELQALVPSMRPLVISALREDPDGHARADNYAQVPDDQCGPVWWLLGLPEPLPAGVETAGDIAREVLDKMADEHVQGGPHHD